MRIFAIRDELNQSEKDVAYLLYYEMEKRFYIELPDDADPWETPLILASILRKGYKTVNSYWSRVWVQQRIVPSDRQNLGQILKESGLTHYDEFELLRLSEGRCSQDSCYITEISQEGLPIGFADRFGKKIEDVVPLAGKSLLVFFRNGEVKRCSLEQMLKSHRQFSPLLKNDAYFQNVGIQTGGYGVCWGEELQIPDVDLYQLGKSVPLQAQDFVTYIQQRVVTTAEARELLQCTKQNIEDLIRRDKLHPIRVDPKNKLFLKSEIMQRLWK